MKAAEVVFYVSYAGSPIKDGKMGNTHSNLTSEAFERQGDWLWVREGREEENSNGELYLGG